MPFPVALPVVTVHTSIERRRLFDDVETAARNSLRFSPRINRIVAPRLFPARGP